MSGPKSIQIHRSDALTFKLRADGRYWALVRVGGVVEADEHAAEIWQVVGRVAMCQRVPVSVVAELAEVARGCVGQFSREADKRQRVAAHRRRVVLAETRRREAAAVLDREGGAA